MSAEVLSARRQASSDVTRLSYEDVSESRGSVCFLYCRHHDTNGPAGERRICVYLKSKKLSNNPPIQATTLLNPARERQSAAASEKIKSRWLPAVLRVGAWRAPQTPSSRWGRKTRSAAAPEAAEVWSERPEGNLGCSSGIAHQPVGNDRHMGGGGKRGVSALSNSAARRVRGHEEETEAISRHHFVSPSRPAEQTHSVLVLEVGTFQKVNKKFTRALPQSPQSNIPHSCSWDDRDRHRESHAFLHEERRGFREKNRGLEHTPRGNVTC